MDIVLKGVTIIDPSSPFHQQTTDIFVQNGFIVEIGIISNTSGKVVTIDSLHVAPGFTDVFSHFCDPGFEFRETLDSGALSATYGGYTDVLVLPKKRLI